MSSSKHVIDLSSDDEPPLPKRQLTEDSEAGATSATAATAAVDGSSAAFASPSAEAASLAIELPPRYANPLVLLRRPKPSAPLQPVRIEVAPPWRGDDGLLVGIFGGARCAAAGEVKVAGFDFDDTLSDRRAAGGKDKWKSTFWNHKFIRSRAMLRVLHARGYCLVVCTNESIGHLKNAQPLRDQLTPKCARVANWAADVGVPVLVLVALSKRGTAGTPPTHPTTGHTLHKQPQSTKGNAGMWHMAEDILGVARGACSGSESFFVGDAAGRERDHGDDDRRLAASAGVQFYTETEFFELDPLRLCSDGERTQPVHGGAEG